MGISRAKIIDGRQTERWKKIEWIWKKKSHSYYYITKKSRMRITRDCYAPDSNNARALRHVRKLRIFFQYHEKNWMF